MMTVTYKDLRIGQKIKIRENTEESIKSRARYKIRIYVVAEKYPHTCIVKGPKGSRRGLSMGDLIINGIIEQRPEIEALKKEPVPRTFRKGGI